MAPLSCVSVTWAVIILGALVFQGTRILDRVDLDNVPGQPPGLVQVMDHLVHDQTPGLFSVVEPVAYRTGSAPGEAQHRQLPSRPASMADLAAAYSGKKRTTCAG